MVVHDNNNSKTVQGQPVVQSYLITNYILLLPCYVVIFINPINFLNSNPDTFLNPKQYFYSEGLHEIFDYVDHETTEFRSRRLDVIL